MTYSEGFYEYDSDGMLAKQRQANQVELIKTLQGQLEVYRQKESKELKELKIRVENPAAQDAWDKYQTVLQLTKK